jgi:hypothetical protein
MSLDIIPTWKQVTADLQHELVDLWVRSGAIHDPTVAAARARQAVCIARDESGALCGVSTAIVRVLPRLRQPLYYYRQFFGEGLRGQKQSVPFLNRSADVLRAYNASSPVPESIGLLMELENPFLARHYDRAWVEEAGSVFLGYSPRGLQLRATYFEGARLLKPVALRRRKPIAA